MNKKSDHIRIRPEDKKLWAEYCRALGTPSPDLFSKIIKSKEINLNERVLVELRKQEEEIKRKLKIR